MSGKSSEKRLRRNSPRKTDSENGSETQQVTESSSLNEQDFDDITKRIECNDKRWHLHRNVEWRN